MHKKYTNFENQTFLEKKLEKISFIYCKMLIKLGSEMSLGFNRISQKCVLAINTKCLNHSFYHNIRTEKDMYLILSCVIHGFPLHLPGDSLAYSVSQLIRGYPCKGYDSMVFSWGERV